MFTAARHGERGGRRADPLAGPLLLRLLQAAILFALLALVPAQAGGIYRCLGIRGEAVFTSSPYGYHHCRRIRLPAAQAPVREGREAGAESAHADAGWQYRQGTATRVPKLPDGGMKRGSRVLRGAVYKIVHADGSIEYTNVRPRGSHARGVRMRTLFTYIATCAACSVHSSIDWAHVPLRMDAYAHAIRAAAARYRLDPALLRAVIHAESAFNPRAVSAKGAQGLMQLTPAIASDMGVKNVFDAGQNIRGGARYLAQLLQTFKGNDRLAAAAYNAGPDAVQKYGGVPPYPETQVYVKRVTLLHKRYRRAMRHAEALASGNGSVHTG